MMYGNLAKEGLNVKVIDQSTLTSDCWGIQFEGLSACAHCEYKNTKKCGGGNTLKKLRKVAG
jgi:hypothetical protein